MRSNNNNSNNNRKNKNRETVASLRRLLGRRTSINRSEARFLFGKLDYKKKRVYINIYIYIYSRVRPRALPLGTSHGTEERKKTRTRCFMADEGAVSSQSVNLIRREQALSDFISFESTSPPTPPPNLELGLASTYAIRYAFASQNSARDTDNDFRRKEEIIHEFNNKYI